MQPIWLSFVRVARALHKGGQPAVELEHAILSRAGRYSTGGNQIHTQSRRGVRIPDFDLTLTRTHSGSRLDRNPGCAPATCRGLTTNTNPKVPQKSHEGQRYAVKIVTSDFRSAGTKCEVFISLLGQTGDSGYVSLDTGFPVGETREFNVSSDKEVGALVGVRMKKGGVGSSQKCDGWLIERVEVTDNETGQQLLIQANAWLGRMESYANGKLERGPIEKTFHANSSNVEVVYLEDSDGEESNAEGKDSNASQRVQVHSAGSALPHPSKVKDGARSVIRKESGHGGEDAYFAVEHNGLIGLGVSDGVYMWRLQGIDAGEFSRGLMTEAAKAVLGGAKGARKVLQVAAAGVAAEGVKGSATVCIVHINTTKGKLSSANIGDSGFLIIREGDPLMGELRQVVHSSEAQEHEFGRPFQLGHHEAANSPDDAETFCTKVEAGDVIVLGSDGLWDNLEKVAVVEQTQLVLSTAPAKTSLHETAVKLSRTLTELAFNASMNRSKDTPYSRAASDAFDMVYSGGKKDDICVVVAIVEAV